MNLTHWISIALAGLSTTALVAQTPANSGEAKNNGSELFARECATCHQPADGSRAPSLETLRALSADAVLTALTAGRMTAQAERLSPAGRAAVAEFVTGKTLSTGTGPGTGLCSTAGERLASSFNKPSWNGWGGSAGSARFAQNGGLAASQVPRLKLAWAFGFSKALAARTQPTVIGDWLFTASDTGDVFALDAITGCTRWTYRAKAGVRGALSVAPLGSSKYGVYFGDGQANAYGLDAQTGRELWTLKVDSHANAAITGAPAVYDGRLYVPMSGVGEEMRGQDPNPHFSHRVGESRKVGLKSRPVSGIPDLTEKWKSIGALREGRQRPAVVGGVITGQ